MMWQAWTAIWRLRLFGFWQWMVERWMCIGTNPCDRGVGPTRLSLIGWAWACGCWPVDTWHVGFPCAVFNYSLPILTSTSCSNCFFLFFIFYLIHERHAKLNRCTVAVIDTNGHSFDLLISIYLYNNNTPSNNQQQQNNSDQSDYYCAHYIYCSCRIFRISVSR